MMAKYKITLIPEAAKEYRKLDGSVKIIVNVAFRKLEQKADTLGGELFNSGDTKLAGCRKIKLCKHGIRIVYRIIGTQIDIVQNIAIGSRAENEVYKTASKRVNKIKEIDS